jgi:hypothetical protein
VIVTFFFKNNPCPPPPPKLQQLPIQLPHTALHLVNQDAHVGQTSCILTCLLYMHIHVCIRPYEHRCICTCASCCVHVKCMYRRHTCRQTYMLTPVHARMPPVHARVRVPLHVYMHVCLHVCLCMYASTCASRTHSTCMYRDSLPKEGPVDCFFLFSFKSVIVEL